jgi:hypothetical protein
MLVAMRVKLPLPSYWPIVDPDPPQVAEVMPGVFLTMGELESLPADLRAWGDRIVFAGHSTEDVRVRQVQDTKTENGWPLTMFGSDVIDVKTGNVVERRLHAVYRFEKHGGVAALRSASVHLFESVVADVLAVLLKGQPDWSTDAIPALADLWNGLKLVPARPVTSAPAPAAPAAPTTSIY